MKIAAAAALLLALRIGDCGLRGDCGFSPCSPQSALLNPKSAIRNPQSNVRNPQSAIRLVSPSGAVAFELSTGGGARLTYTVSLGRDVVIDHEAKEMIDRYQSILRESAA